MSSQKVTTSLYDMRLHAHAHLGILAHVDAGKTTLTERILFTAGARITVAPLSPEAAAWADSFGQGFPGDAIDRLLYATSRDLRVPLVSKDDGLRAFAATTGDVEIV